MSFIFHYGLPVSLNRLLPTFPRGNAVAGRCQPNDLIRWMRLSLMVVGFHGRTQDLTCSVCPAQSVNLQPPLYRDDRRALELVFLDGLMRTEAAKLLGVPARTVEARLGRALLHLRMHAACAAGGARVRVRSHGGRVHCPARTIVVG